jgi:hypothetical protein
MIFRRCTRSVHRVRPGTDTLAITAFVCDQLSRQLPTLESRDADVGHESEMAARIVRQRVRASLDGDLDKGLFRG